LFGENLIQNSRKAIINKYSLLPYFYTLFFDTHLYGGSVIRSIPFEFYEDNHPLINYLDRQFMLGSCLLISPVLENGKRDVDAYFPKDNLWFDYFTGELIKNVGNFIKISAPLDHIPVHLRGGCIIPLQIPSLTTFESRKNPFELIVSLNSHKTSFGKLILDDGESLSTIKDKLYSIINFKVQNNTLEIIPTFNNFNIQNKTLKNIKIYGIFQNICHVRINNSPINDFNYRNNVLIIFQQNIFLINKNVITWVFC